jgi:hypothetical protein
VADPLLRDVRTCLDAAGAKHVPSVLVVRWDSDGKPGDVRIDVPGYESLPCVQKAQSKLATLQNPHETVIRCEFGCPTPTPPAVVAPPVTAPSPAPAAAPPAAPAAVAATPAPPKPEYEKVWYGYQTLIADGASAGLFFAGIGTGTSPMTVAGYLTFVLATPVIHMVHGNIGPGFGSMGIRLLLPPIGMGVGALAGVIIAGTNGSGSLDRFGNGANGAINGLVIGGLLGAAGCVLIDAAGLGYTKERVDTRSAAPGTQHREQLFAIAPTFDVQKDHTTFGVVGSF